MSESFDTLLRLAALSRSESADDLRELERELDELDEADSKLLWFAVKVLEGRAAEVTTNEPERYREFAEHVGATLEEVESDWSGLRRFIFRPPAAQ
jgi:hypothetical protein